MTTTILPEALPIAASTDNAKARRDAPRISAAQRRNPVTVASRQEAYERFSVAIRKSVPGYSAEELHERATVWTDAAIEQGAIIIAGAS
jgi:hypothetical protein